jgi:NIMA (never in mitosis gene a)-related kinase
MHRDLKSANVFKTGSGYKLGDMNVSKVVSGSLAYTQTGTPYYASPEVWRDEPYDCKSDIWSLGCIVFEMAMLRPPFEGKDMEELFRNIQNRPVPGISNYYSRELAEFVQGCLRKKAAQRPTAGELLGNGMFQAFINIKPQ